MQRGTARARARVYKRGARAQWDALMSFTERFWKVFDREIRIGTSVYVT